MLYSSDKMCTQPYPVVFIVYAVRYIKRLLPLLRQSLVRVYTIQLIIKTSYLILYLCVSLALSDGWHWPTPLTGLTSWPL